MVNGNRDMLLGNLQLKVEDKVDRYDERNGRKLSISRHTIKFFPEQEELFVEAAERRFGKDRHGRAEYIRLATLAFVAYDLDLDFLELATSKPMPKAPGAAELAFEASARKRGLWGIIGLANKQRGKK